MKVLDLFAGIGGFSLAAHRCGWETVGFVEWDEYNQKVLAKNFPNIPIHGDIKTYKGTKYSADIVCGGFPCQPFSTAGKRQGASDDRYLWPEMLRVIREVQPTWVVGENVAGIYSMDDGSVFEQVCTSLEDEGYQVQPFRIPACATGAPHRRDRWWFVAHSDDILQRRQADGGIIQGETGEIEGPKQWEGWDALFREWSWAVPSNGLEDSVAAYASIEDDRGYSPEQDQRQKPQSGNGVEQGIATNPNGAGPQEQRKESRQMGKAGRTNTTDRSNRPTSWLEAATRLCRVDDGLPAWIYRHRAKRLKSLGNAIHPGVAYQIFQAIKTPS